jgi:hypothetical protein
LIVIWLAPGLVVKRYKPTSHLVPSGLLGPVTVIRGDMD